MEKGGSQSNDVERVRDHKVGGERWKRGQIKKKNKKERRKKEELMEGKRQLLLEKKNSRKPLEVEWKTTTRGWMGNVVVVEDGIKA